MNKTWWKESVVYQIYPRSFYDSNGDGIGDLRGIIQKLDHLKKLGVSVVWLSPVYKSPNDDAGYDISNYQDIMDEFGTLADWEEMIAGMHQRGIKLLMDLVVNHTSDEHPWFTEARKSKNNPYRDYYIWRPGKPGKPAPGSEPNNWVSFFSGSAWQYDDATDEYYLHLFSRKQPDLNWENPRVRAEVFGMMNWWLKKGVDGFRMDVINLISKVDGLPDAPISNPNSLYQWGGQYFANGPRFLEFLHEMKQEVLSKYDIFTVGEAPMVDTDWASKITNEETGSLNMVFQFEHMALDSLPGDSKWNLAPWKLTDLKTVTTRWQKGLEGRGWNSLYFSNHDQPRTVSRFGNDGPYRVESAKMLGTFLHMLQGTPYVYQGEEIGMTNVRFASIEEHRDIETHNIYRELIKSGLAPQAILEKIYAKGRDNARTPVQWNAQPQAGFTTSAEPWLQVNPNYTTINVEQAYADPNSIFYYYQRLIELRKHNPVMVYGTYDILLPDHEQIYAFTRTLDADRLLVICNFSAAAPVFKLPVEVRFSTAELVISNYDAVDPAEDIHQIALRPYEARVYRLA
jgi:oligo-1,6-glucosidase